MQQPADIQIVLSGPYYLRQISRLQRDLQELLYLREPQRVQVDMSGLTFMGPAAMALALATLSKALKDKLLASGSYITAPRSRGMYTYLSRMDFMRVLFSGEDPFQDVERHDTAGLRECQHFVSEPEGRAVAKSLAEALQEKVTTDQPAKISLELCLSELTENVHYHADTPHGGFAVAQAFKSSKEIEVAIVDLGVGIAASLGQNPAHAHNALDDVTAIRTAMEPLVTATPGRNRGYGLAFTRFLLNLNQGHLLVRSGNGHVQVGEKAAERHTDAPLPGTLVALRLHTDRPFDFEGAYALLTEAIDALEGKLDDDVRTLSTHAPR